MATIMHFSSSRPTPNRALVARYAAVGLLAWVVGAVHLPGRPRTFCLLRATTGVPCPFCGGTTAVADLGQGQLTGALAASPLTLLAVMALPWVGNGWLPNAWRGRGMRITLLLGLLAAAEIWQLVRFGILGG